MVGLQGRVFDGYRLTEQIGGGGIAEVYRAQPTTAGGREAVVKVVHPEFARQPGFIPNFRHIVQMTGKLTSHPHILPLLAHGEDSGYLYFITPYVKDGTLRDWLARGGRLNAGDVAPFFRQLGDALGYVHSMGVVHGNLKPNNIYLFEGRHVLLGDFGLLWDIRQLDMNHSGSGAEVVEYLAPEAFSGQVTQLSDIYSLGAVLFATLTGHAPFRGARPADVFAAHTTLPTPSLAQANPSLAPGIMMLDSVIQRAMAKRPEDRFPSATLLAQTVETVAQQAQQTQHTQQAQQAQQPSFWASPNTQFGAGAGPFSLPPGGINVEMGGAGGAGMAGGMIAGMAGIAGVAGGATSLAQLNRANPPFPPLPGAVDERMDQGRFDAVGNDPSASPTMRMPTSATPRGQEQHMGALGSPNSPNMLGYMAGPAASIDTTNTVRGPAFQPPANVGALGAAGMNGAGTAYANPLNPRAVPPASSSSGSMQRERGFPGPDESIGGIEGFAPPMLPVIRPPQDAISAPQGQRMWDEEWNGNGGGRNGDWDDQGDHTQDESHWGADSSYTSEYTGYSGAYTAAGQHAARDETGYHEGMDDRPFSATALGLPRLTNPAMGDMPPSWQELIAEEVAPGPRQFVFDDHRDRGDRSDRARGPASQASSTFDDSQMWSAASLEAAGGRDSYSASRQMGSADHASGNLADDGHYRAPAESERKPKRRRRWIPVTLVALILLTLVQLLALAVVRPDLCGTHVCTTIAHTVHGVFPGLGVTGAATPAPFRVAPGSGKITVAQGGIAVATFALVNTTSQPLSWLASASQPWLIPGPASGSLGVGSSLPLVLTAKPTTVAPNTYTAQLKVQAGGVTQLLPVTVTVMAGPKLTVTPTTLSFASCGVAQNITVQNSGAGTLTYDATPSQASAVTLGSAKGSLAAGASASIAVAMNCSAYFGHYSVSITSNGATGGSVQVALQYT
ncbi:MAG: protein kinase [Ktedonobacterales bacterium]